jgi:hypothetical protein
MTPFHIVYDPHRGWYCITEVGLITLEDILEIFEVMRNDTNYWNATAVLADVRRARTTIGLRDAKTIAQQAPRHPSNRRVAVVARPGILAGLHKRVSELIDRNGSLRVFYEMEDAAAWLESELVP